MDDGSNDNTPVLLMPVRTLILATITIIERTTVSTNVKAIIIPIVLIITSMLLSIPIPILQI